MKKTFYLLLGLPLVISSCSTPLFHIHSFNGEYHFDSEHHWQTCSCGMENKEEHFMSDWIIDVDPTEENDGTMHKVCSICEYEIEETIHATGSVDKLNFQLEEYIEEESIIHYYSVSALSLDIEDKVVIPAYHDNTVVTLISNEAFKGCEHINQLVIGENIETIGISAFEGCILLNSINIPENVKIIADAAFKGCIGVEEISYQGTIDDWKEKVTLGVDWALDINVSVIRCSDGDVGIN